MTNVNKAGCILINTTTKKVGLIYRSKQNDYSFPKGHVEENESIMECAIRETEEETQRFPEILASLPEQSYTDSNGDVCKVSWFLARDLGESHKYIKEELKHELVWFNMEEVAEKLSYDNLIALWKQVEDKVLSYFDQLA